MVGVCPPNAAMLSVCRLKGQARYRQCVRTVLSRPYNAASKKVLYVPQILGVASAGRPGQGNRQCLEFVRDASAREACWEALLTSTKLADIIYGHASSCQMSLASYSIDGTGAPDLPPHHNERFYGSMYTCRFWYHNRFLSSSTYFRHDSHTSHPFRVNSPPVQSDVSKGPSSQLWLSPSRLLPRLRFQRLPSAYCL